MTAAALEAVDTALVRLAGATRVELSHALAGIGVPERELKMRASQLWHWIYHRGARDFPAMRNIARPLLKKLADRYTLGRPEIVTEQVSADGTRKWLLRMAPAHRFDKGAEIECVYIPDPTGARSSSRVRWAAPSTARFAIPARCRWCAI